MQTSKAKILIVDDEDTARYAMRRALQPIAADIREAEDGRSALEFIQSFQPDVVLCDMNMPKMTGMELLKTLASIPSGQVIPPLIIAVTAYGSEKIAVEAMKAGAYDYLSKPYDIDELRLLVKKMLEQIALKRENIRLKEEMAIPAADIIGESPAIQQIHRLVHKVAPTDVTVLITGESGTGKELLARTIHRASGRADGPYITMNCAAIPKDLVESELFGHEKGAFTGAIDRRPGKFELAHRGTLFLDEIADMSLDTQAKILRVLEDKSFIRLGGKEVIHADVRLISATNKNLENEIESGAFRRDLYYRLKVIELKLPPLRQRREDIPMLANFYLNKFASRHSKPIKRIGSQAMKILYHYDWPGNIRQLIHVIEQSVVLAEGDNLTIEDLPFELQQTQESPASETIGIHKLGAASFTQMKEEVIADFERRIIAETLGQTNGNVSQAARLLQMKRQFLQTKMKKLGIEGALFRK
ncbi:sigma-54-dependent Fis family transcriptional regulator [candidate division KSB1 bacterium]|nr:sigma-54-dependent Fis family transcriptional regulator [candidate division KSB1 bacterium]